MSRTISAIFVTCCFIWFAGWERRYPLSIQHRLARTQRGRERRDCRGDGRLLHPVSFSQSADLAFLLYPLSSLACSGLLVCPAISCRSCGGDDLLSPGNRW